MTKIVYDRLLNVLFILRSCVAWFVMRVFGIECTFKEVKDGFYSYDKNKTPLISDETQFIDGVLQLCREIYEQEDKRQSTVNEKCKVLLTISTVLVAVVTWLLKGSFSLLGLLPLLFI